MLLRTALRCRSHAAQCQGDGPPVHRALFRALLREACYFDERPLARALLASAPSARWDSGCRRWQRLRSTSEASRTVDAWLRASSTQCGCHGQKHAPQTGATTMANFIAAQFRATSAPGPVGLSAGFAALRRLRVIREAHDALRRHGSCGPPRTAVAAGNALLPQGTIALLESPSLLIDTATACAAEGATPPNVASSVPPLLLAAHPTCLDRSAQAVCMLVPSSVLSASAESHADEAPVFAVDINKPANCTVMLALHADGHCGGELDSASKSARRRGKPEKPAFAIRAAAARGRVVAHLGALPLHLGGPNPSEAIVLHTSTDICAALAKRHGCGRGRRHRQLTSVHGNFFVHTLAQILTLPFRLVEHLDASNCRVVVNHREWDCVEHFVGVVAGEAAMLPLTVQHQGTAVFAIDDDDMWAAVLSASGCADLVDFSTMPTPETELPFLLPQDSSFHSGLVDDCAADDAGSIVGRAIVRSWGDAPLEDEEDVREAEN